MKKVLPALLLAFILNACSDDEERTISITRNGNVTFARSLSWVFISDREGKPIDYGELPSNGTVTLRIPSHVTDDVVTLSFFARPLGIGSQEVLLSFAEISPGAYSISNTRNVSLPGNAEITVQNISDDIDVNFSGQAWLSSRNGSVFSTSVFFDGSSAAQVLVTAFNKTTYEGRLRMISVIPNTPMTLDYEKFDEFDVQHIDLTGQTGTLLQRGVKDGLEFKIRDSQFILNDQTPTGISLYGSGIFDSYITNISIYDGTDSYSNTYYESPLPSTFEKLNANFELVSNDEAGFVFNASGSSDMLQVVFNYKVSNTWGADSYYQRSYILPAKSTVTFNHPQIPEEIANGVVYPFGELRLASVADYDMFEGYNDLITFRLRENNDLYPETKSGVKRRTKGF
jgi:hypothetical protein